MLGLHVAATTRVIPRCVGDASGSQHWRTPDDHDADVQGEATGCRNGIGGSVAAVVFALVILGLRPASQAGSIALDACKRLGGGRTFPCQAPVAALIVHGTADQDEPIASGELNVTSWSFHNRCGTERKPAAVDGCAELADCLNDYPVLWCQHEGGHGWPDLLRRGKLLAWLQRT